ncbi:MAG TPA: hypothetical protein VFZ98_01220 [Vicinamibacterales bacterium]
MLWLEGFQEFQGLQELHGFERFLRFLRFWFQRFGCVNRLRFDGNGGRGRLLRSCFDMLAHQLG